MSHTAQTAGECRLPRASAAVRLLRVSRACGAAPVTLERHRCHDVARVSRKYAVVGYGITTVIGMVIVAAMVVEFNIDVSKELKTKDEIRSLIIDYINYILISVTAGLAVGGALGRIRHFLIYHTRIQQIHVSINNKWMSKRLEKVLSVTLGCSLAVVVFASIYDIVVSTREVIYYQWSLIIHALHKLFHIVHVMTNLLALQIVFVVAPALWTLKALNKSIVRLQDRLQDDGATEDDVSSTIDTIRRYVKTYTAITNVCSEINATEGFTMLLILFDATFRIITLLFHSNFTSHTSDSRWWMYAQMASHTLNLVRMSFNVVVLVEPCHRTHEELKKTQELISRALCVPPSALDSVSIALVNFYEATEGCTLVYVPMGTFEFSRSVYTALVGGLTTVIVIISSI